MPLYRVIIHGRNFRLKMEGKWEKCGFYTPRFAEAPDAVMAEQVALEDFRHSPKYRDLMGRSLNSKDDAPVLCGEDIEEVVPGTESAKAAGLALYRESAEDGAEHHAALDREQPIQPGCNGDVAGGCSRPVS